MRSWVALLLALALVLAACGGDDDGEAQGTAEDEEAAVDPAGILRIPHDLTAAGGVRLDPLDMNTPTDFWIHYMMYGTLLRQMQDGAYEPYLAESAEVVDPSTIEITLRDGLTFQDGSPLDAEAVKQGILRNAASTKGQTFRLAELKAVESIDVGSPTELTINLSQPIAGSFYNLLAHQETMPVSQQAVTSGVDLNTNPVGAGPFRFVEYLPERRITMEKWDGFYAAEDIELAGVEIIHVASPPALVNAFQTEAVDAGPLATPDLVDELAGISNVETITERSDDGILWLSLQCQAYPVLQDVRVRKALNYATDKEALNQVLYDGEGEPMSQVWPSDSKYFNENIADIYEHDPERAQELLAEAGHEDLQLTIAVPADGGVALTMAEVLQAQWQQAGIRLELVRTPNSIQDYYLDKKMHMYPTLQTRSWTDKVTRNWVAGSVGNTCPPNDPEFDAMVAELRGFEPGSDEAIDVWHDVSEYLSENAQGVWGVITTRSAAYNPERVGNPSWTPNQLGALYPDVFEVFIKR